MVLKTLMDQWVSGPKYLGLVQQPNKKLSGISRDISGLRRVSEGQTPSTLLKNRRTCAIRTKKPQRDSERFRGLSDIPTLFATNIHSITAFSYRLRIISIQDGARGLFCDPTACLAGWSSAPSRSYTQVIHRVMHKRYFYDISYFSQCIMVW